MPIPHPRALAGALLCLLVSLTGFGCSESVSGPGAGPAGPAGGGAGAVGAEDAGQVPGAGDGFGPGGLAPGLPGTGHLEVVDPETPERPLFRNFGELQYGTERPWVTTVKNVGSAPVEIVSAQAACGCTRLTRIEVRDPESGETEVLQSFDERHIATIPVGAEARMTIQLMTKFSTPNKSKLAQFRLTTDSVTTPFMTFELSFLPTRAFIFSPGEARLLNVPTTHGAEARIKVLVQKSGDLGRVLGIESVPDGIEAELITESFAGEFVWFIALRVPPGTPLGALRGQVVVTTTDKFGEGDEGRLELPVLVQIVPDVVLEPPIVAFRGFGASEGATFEGRLTALVPGANLDVLSATIDAPNAGDYEVEVAPISPTADGRAIAWDVRVRVLPGHAPGYVGGDVVFDLAEPIGGTRPGTPNTQVRARMTGIVQER